VDDLLPSACKWTDIAKELDNGRNGKQCRDRWTNYLRPGIKKGGWTRDEEELIKDMHRTFGPK
jgi:myb proto-oncogene protein